MLPETQVLSSNILMIGFAMSCLPLSNAQPQGINDDKLPDYIAPCYRDHPMFAECVRMSLYGVVQKMASGVPELDVPPIEPLTKEVIDDIDVAGFSLKSSNATIWGVSTMKFTWNSASTKTKVFDFEGVVDTMHAIADHDLSGFFLVPIHATGTINAICEQIDFRVNMIVDVLPRNGIEYVVVNDMKVKTYLNDGSLWISNLGPFEGVINQLLNSRINTRFLLNRIAPIIDESVANVLSKYSNRILNTVRYDMFLPEGTGPVSASYVKPNDFDEAFFKYKKKNFLEKIKNTLD